MLTRTAGFRDVTRRKQRMCPNPTSDPARPFLDFSESPVPHWEITKLTRRILKKIRKRVGPTDIFWGVMFWLQAQRLGKGDGIRGLRLSAKHQGGLSHALVHTLGAREDKNLGQVFWDFVWAPLTPPPSLYKAHHFPLQFPQFWFSIFVARKQILRVDLPMIFAARKQKQKQKSEGQTFCFRVSFCFSAGSTESVLEKHFPLVFS